MSSKEVSLLIAVPQSHSVPAPALLSTSVLKECKASRTPYPAMLLPGPLTLKTRRYSPVFHSAPP